MEGVCLWIGRFKERKKFGELKCELFTKPLKYEISREKWNAVKMCDRTVPTVYSVLLSIYSHVQWIRLLQKFRLSNPLYPFIKISDHFCSCFLLPCQWVLVGYLISQSLQWGREQRHIGKDVCDCIAIACTGPTLSLNNAGKCTLPLVFSGLYLS